MFVSLDIPAMTAKVRLLADKRDSEFVSDTEILDLMEDSFELLYNKLVDLNEGYYLQQVDVRAGANSEIIFPDGRGNLSLKDGSPAPALYKLTLLEKVDGDKTTPIFEKTLQEVSQVSSSIVYDYISPIPFGYVLFNDRLRLYPLESAQGLMFRLSYSRDPLIENDPKSETNPVAKDRTLKRENTMMQRTWEKYISYKTAYTIGVIEENPKQALGDLALELENKITGFASQRNRGVRVVQDLEYHRGYSSLVL